MPYVKQIERDRVDHHIAVVNQEISGIGMFTYVLYRMMDAFCRHRSFYAFALVFGATMCALFEFYRRIVAPYENLKILDNGDVH